MTSRPELTQTFCKVLKSFLDDMYASYPDTSLYMLIKTTEMMIAANPASVVENFMFCIEPYIEKIKNKDISFFLDGGLENSIKEGPYTFLLDELKKISNIWKNPKTSNKTKESIWKYFQILETLGTKLKK
jgi:hypothetical protein